MKDIGIRKPGPLDSAFAYASKKAAFREYAEQVWGWDEDEQLRLHAERSQAQDCRILSVGDKDVGVMAEARRAGLPVLLRVLKVDPRAGVEGAGG